MNEMLRIRGLQKNFGARRVLAVESFAAAAGECALIFGDNGCGKTTLLKILAGLMRPDAVAEWRFDGRECRPSGRGAAGAVLLHQTPFMFAAATRANVAVAARDRGRIDSALRWAGLSRVAGAPARGLSGGEKARVSLARARAAEMKLCLMDEPAAHLDAAGLELAADLVADLRRRGAATIIAAPSRTDAIPYDRAWRLENDGRLTENV
ncbi:MAG: ABC transporter ATP-binding protein [Gammaproteobacteria bacterium]